MGIFSGNTRQYVVGDVLNFVAASTLTPNSPLLEERKKVKWSTLGLISGIKEMKKLICNHELEFATSYRQVFVADLGCDAYSFYGFSILDAKFLHTKEQQFMEMPSHLAQMELYVYSLVTHNILLHNYGMEFVIHGLAGFVLNRYVESVYGVHDRNYRVQKMHDTTVYLDSSGYALPLCAQSLSEQIERFSPNFITYMKCKAPVLFHLIENIIGQNHMDNLIKDFFSQR